MLSRDPSSCAQPAAAALTEQRDRQVTIRWHGCKALDEQAAPLVAAGRQGRPSHPACRLWEAAGVLHRSVNHRRARWEQQTTNRRIHLTAGDGARLAPCAESTGAATGAATLHKLWPWCHRHAHASEELHSKELVSSKHHVTREQALQHGQCRRARARAPLKPSQARSSPAGSLQDYVERVNQA